MLEVSKRQLAWEVAVYEQHSMLDTAGIEKALGQLRLRREAPLASRACRVHLDQDLDSNLVRLYHLLEAEPSDTDPCLVDYQHHFAAAIVAPVALPLKPLALPVWAKAEARNGQGVLPRSSLHYIALIGINRAYAEAIVDPSGAHTMLNRVMANKLGLQVEVAGAGKWFGSFLGSSAKPVPYYGRVPGPVTIRFSANVSFYLPELKIITHSEPLALLGTEILGSVRPNAWGFKSIGPEP